MKLGQSVKLLISSLLVFKSALQVSWLTCQCWCCHFRMSSWLKVFRDVATTVMGSVSPFYAEPWVTWAKRTRLAGASAL